MSLQWFHATCQLEDFISYMNDMRYVALGGESKIFAIVEGQNNVFSPSKMQEREIHYVNSQFVSPRETYFTTYFNLQPYIVHDENVG